ncbi:uncharacterized protein [Amphiura filiformis]|uniref:uncharacterized protein n=1 Tax=Amphiura filiformis TaxID=82378 RepID=UPI003B214488
MAVSLTTQSCDLAKCSICHQLLKSPRTLPCLHSYCAICLEKHTKDSSPSSKVKCVECGEEFNIPPGGLKEWQPLAIVHRVTEQKAIQMQTMSEETIYCTACAGVGEEDEQGDDYLLLKEYGSEFEVAPVYGSLKAVLEDVVVAEPPSIIHAAKNLTDVKFEENKDKN